MFKVGKKTKLNEFSVNKVKTTSELGSKRNYSSHIKIPFKNVRKSHLGNVTKFCFHYQIQNF